MSLAGGSRESSETVFVVFSSARPQRSTLSHRHRPRTDDRSKPRTVEADISRIMRILALESDKPSHSTSLANTSKELRRSSICVRHNSSQAKPGSKPTSFFSQPSKFSFFFFQPSVYLANSLDDTTPCPKTC